MVQVLYPGARMKQFPGLGNATVGFAAKAYRVCLLTIIFLLTLGAVIAVLWTLVLWYRYHPHMPWRDTLPLLRELRPLIDGGPVDLRALLEPHYTAHRVLVPRLLLWLDVVFFHAQSHLLIGLGWLSMVLLLLLQAVMGRPYFGARHGGLAVSLALMTMLLFSPAHLQNLLNPLNSSWHLSIALSMLAFCVLLLGPTELTVTRIFFACMLLCLAAFTNFTGIIAWLLLPLLVLLSRSRYSIWVGLLSATFVLVYMQGVSSDAEIAITMAVDLPQTDAVRDLQQNASALISDNTLPQIGLRTLDLLAWPASQASSGWPRLLALLSLLGLAALWLLVARNWWLRRPRLHRWVEFCLLGATLCLGVAISIQLGRLLPYPDALHGPSPERYQTFIVCYWSYIVGLTISLATVYPGWRQLVGVVLVSLATLLLINPPTNTLRNELRSAEYAAMVYLVGEQSELQPVPRSIAAVYTPDYALAFDPFFQRHQGAYHAPVSLPPETQDLPGCEALGLRVEQVLQQEPLVLVMAVNASFQPLAVNLAGLSATTTRHILLFNGGQLVGRLVPLHRGDYSPYQLFKPGYYQWMGGYLKSAVRQRWSVLSMESLLGPRRSCKLLLP